MNLREFTSKDGLQVQLMDLHLKYVFENAIECSRGTAYAALIEKIKKELISTQPIYIVGFSEKDSSVETRWQQSNRWPPHEEVTARCRSWWVPKGTPGNGSTFLTIKWYQDEGNPFEYLSSAIRKIDWKIFSFYQEFQN